MIKLTFFIHGTTVDNEQHISSGWRDAELSARGVAESKKLRDLTKDRRFDVVLCSDLRRAIDSAELGFGRKVKIIVDKRLRECNYGALNGKPSSIVEPLQEQNITTRFPEGESYEDVKARIADFLTDIKANYQGKSVAIISHKAPQLALDVLLKGKTWEQAFAEDWRKTGAWQAGWQYQI
jgi:broad specificity phosphatase PhoE